MSNYRDSVQASKFKAEITKRFNAASTDNKFLLTVASRIMANKRKYSHLPYTTVIMACVARIKSVDEDDAMQHFSEQFIELMIAAGKIERPENWDDIPMAILKYEAKYPCSEQSIDVWECFTNLLLMTLFPNIISSAKELDIIMSKFVKHNIDPFAIIFDDKLNPFAHMYDTGSTHPRTFVSDYPDE